MKNLLLLTLALALVPAFSPASASSLTLGGLLAFTDGNVTVSTFLHAPGGVLPPVRPGGPQSDCDGTGLDSLAVCFGE